MNNCYSFNQKKRLDHLAVNKYSHLSRAKIQFLIKNGYLQVNGVICKDPSYKILSTATITLIEPKKITSEIKQETQEKPSNESLSIVFEDEHLLIINKPSGIVVHPAPGHQKNTLLDQLIAFYNPLTTDQSLNPKLVHRLDKDTSGLLLVAKTEFAYVHLKEQFINRSIKRCYYAFVAGVLTPPIGKIYTSISRHPINRKKMTVTKNGRLAITNYCTKKIFGSQVSLLECKLETGRTHQIRVHLHYLKHPIIGDKTYGGKNCYPFTRQALHAYKIQFIHPKTNQINLHEIPLSDDLELLYQNLEQLYGIK